MQENVDRNSEAIARSGGAAEAQALSWGDRRALSHQGATHQSSLGSLPR